MKPLRLSPAIPAAIAAVSLSSTAFAALTVVNGDFQNTSGLWSLGGGWYGGVPVGWQGRTGTNYTVGDPLSNGNLVANTEQLSSPGPFQPFYQDLGILDAESTITLSFDFSHWGTGPRMGAAIWSGAGVTTLANADFTTDGLQTLTATNVAAGTAIRIGFWRVFGSPGIDNVAMAVTPVPEPHSALLGGLGLLALLRRRRN
jgi:MYXO-CTERM domain-containing protein